MMPTMRVALLAFTVVAGAHFGLLAQTPSAPPAETAVRSFTLAEQEEFLQKAKVTRTRGASKGITGTLRATLSDGRVTHDASIQTIDEYKQRFEGTQGTEFNFRDSWRYNVAAYRLDRLLDLGMIPPSVERMYNGKHGSFTWWVDDVIMDEAERLKKKVAAPDARRWNEQMWHVRMFDQLIYNVDRNLGNLVIDKGWTIWMIDHTRAFRLLDAIKAPGNLAQCDRRVIERLKAVDRETLKTTMKDYLAPNEIDALLKRRDRIVEHFEKRNAIFDWDRPARPGQQGAGSPRAHLR
jgi:hypothetical protein